MKIMPKLDKQFILKGPCPIELEAELQHLTSDEKAVIYVVMQKDLKFKEAMTNKKEDKEILDDWGKRVSNLTAPILVPPKGKEKINFVWLFTILKLSELICRPEVYL